MFRLLTVGLVFGALSGCFWSLAFRQEFERLVAAVRDGRPRSVWAFARAITGWGRAGGTSRPRFERVAFQTGRSRTSGAGGRDPGGSRTVAALELAVLIALTGAVLAGATLGAGRVIEHFISQVHTG